MGQETHYYNNVIAQLVELRDETKQGNQDSQTTMTEKLNEVIDAIEKIQVTAENIKIEAGTINLSTDEVETLLRTVNTNLNVINDNINEFDTNIKTELDTFVATTKEEFAKLTLNNNTNHDSLTNTITDEFTKLKTDNTTKHTTLNKTITDEFAKLNKNITDGNSASDTAVTDKLDEVKTDLILKLETNKTGINAQIDSSADDIIQNDNTIATALNTLITALKDANHTDLVSVKTILDTINANIDAEFAALETNDYNNTNRIIAKLNTALAQIGDVTSPVKGSVAKLLITINDTLTNSGTDSETNLTALKTAIETASTEIQTLITSNHYTIKNAISNVNITSVTNKDSIVTSVNNNSDKIDLSNTKLDNIINNLNDFKNNIDKEFDTTYLENDTINTFAKLFYETFSITDITKNNFANNISIPINVIQETFGNLEDDVNSSSYNKKHTLMALVKSIADASSTGGETSATTNQLITDIKTLVDAIKTNDGTNTKSIVDAINAIKVTAESIKIDAGTINLSTDEVEGLLRTSNTNTDNIKNSLIKKSFNSGVGNYSIHDLLQLLNITFGGTNEANSQTLMFNIYKIRTAIGELIDANDKSIREILENVDINLAASGQSTVTSLANLETRIGKEEDGADIVGSINGKLRYIANKENEILTELGNIKTAITNQTTAITEAMTAQTTAIVEAINNITGNGTYKVVMVDDTPPPQ